MARHLLLCFLLSTLVASSLELKILVVEPVISPSHHVWSVKIVEGLLQRGHQVHFASILPMNVKDDSGKNLTMTIFEDVLDAFHNDDEFDPGAWGNLNVFQTIYLYYDMTSQFCEKLVATRGAKQVVELVKTVEFDVIVQDITMQCFEGLWGIKKENTALVGYTPYGPAPWVHEFVGGSSYPAYRAYPAASFLQPTNIWQKTMNFLYYTADSTMRHYYSVPDIQRLTEKFVGQKVKPVPELMKSVSVMLLNTYSTFEPGVPLAPNAIEVGGLHAQIAKPIKDEKIRRFLDEAEHGVVVVSLGTNVRWSDFLGEEKLREITLTLSKLKQRVLWKLKEDVSFPIPDNIMILKWLPQCDVLAHKNVKAIWSHGGLLSTQEAVWYGVPIIVMPFFMDQKTNEKIILAKEVGVTLDFRTLTPDTITGAFQKILYDPKYAENMKKVSAEFRDRAVPPLDLATWYVEYAARHPSGNLQAPGRHLSWTEQNLYDVYAFLLSIVLILFYVIRYAFQISRKFLISRLFHSKKKQM